MTDINEGGYRTLSAFFDSQSDAERASERLVDAGIARESIQLTSGSESDTPVDARAEHRTGFFGALANFFFPDEDRYAYAEGLSRGGFLVVVNDLPAALHERAVEILDKEGSIDLDERADTWRSEGWTGYSNTDSFAGANAGVTGATYQVGTRDADFGRSRVRSYTREEPFTGVDKTAVEIEDERAIEAERINKR